jgi:hypothetical protein
VTRRPSKPSKDLPLPRTEPEDTKARALAALLVPPDPLAQLAEWRAKVAARHSLKPAKSPPKKKR